MTKEIITATDPEWPLRTLCRIRLTDGDKVHLSPIFTQEEARDAPKKVQAMLEAWTKTVYKEVTLVKQPNRRFDFT